MTKSNKRSLLLVIIAIATLILILGSATFAFFATGRDLDNGILNTNVATAGKMYQFTATSNGNIEMDIAFNEMSEANVSTNVLKSDNATIDVSLASPSEGVATICTYDVVWVWDSDVNNRYITPDMTLPSTIDNKTYNYEFSVTIDNKEEKDLSTYKLEDNKLTLTSKEIITSSSLTPTTKTHTIEANIYNLPIDQKNLFNKQFKAHITVENLNCEIKTGNVYFINYIDDLVALSNEVNSAETLETRDVILMRDLDFNMPDSYNGTFEELSPGLTTGTGFPPIGGFPQIFSGSFDGQGHTISGLYIDNNQPNSNISFFGTTNNSVIKDLTIQGNINTSVVSNIGGLIGNARGNSRIENIISKVTITSADSNNWALGGIVGGNGLKGDGNIVIKNCKNYNNISGGGNLTGGIVGWSEANLTLLDGCANYGTITSSHASHLGGIIGADQNISTTTITNSHNEGSIIANQANENSTYSGGLMGISNGELTIKDSYNKGNISNSKKEYTNWVELTVGGLVGLTYGDGTTHNKKIENAYNDGDISGGNRTGGLIGINNNPGGNLIINNCYNTAPVNVLNENTTFYPQAGGLIGTNWISNANILNSYNIGEITSSRDVGGGIVGSNDTNSEIGEIVIVNSYNIGDITVTNAAASGISNNYGAASVINNVYNIGKVSGSSSSNSYEITYINNDSYTLTNAYYKSSANRGSNKGTTTSMSIANMQAQSFVDTLNNNINSINLTTYSSKLAGYTLCPWKMGDNNYPTLDCE